MLHVYSTLFKIGQHNTGRRDTSCYIIVKKIYIFLFNYKKRKKQMFFSFLNKKKYIDIIGKKYQLIFYLHIYNYVILIYFKYCKLITNPIHTHPMVALMHILFCQPLFFFQALINLSAPQYCMKSRLHLSPLVLQNYSHYKPVPLSFPSDVPLSVTQIHEILRRNTVLLDI